MNQQPHFADHTPGRDAALDLLKDAVDALEEGFILWDQDLKFLFCNEKYKELALPPGHPGPDPGQDAVEFGYEIFETGFWHIPDGLGVHSFAEQIGELIRSYVQDLEIIRADGRVILASSNKTALGGYVLTFIDVTDSRKADEKRLEAFNDAIEATQDGLALFDRDGRFVLGNKAWHSYYADSNVTPKPGDRVEDLHRHFIDDDVYIVPDGMTKDEFYRAGIEGIYAYDKDFILTFADGRICEATCNRTDLGAYLLSYRDVTDRSRAEAAEQTRWDVLNDAVGSLEEGFSLWDADFRLLLCNGKYMEMIAPYRDKPFEAGLSGEAVISETFRSGIIDFPEELDEKSYIRQWITWARSHGDPIEVAYKDGRSIIVSAKHTELGGVLITTVDVTAIKRAEQKRLEAFNEVVQATENGLALFDKDGRFVLANRAMHAFFAPSSLILEPGKRIEDIHRQLVDEDFYVVPEGMTKDEYYTEGIEAIYTYATGYLLQSTSGRICLADCRRTELGAYLLSYRDVTEAQLAEQKRLEAVTDAIQATDDCLVLFDKDVKFVLANDAWIATFWPHEDPPAPGSDGAVMFRDLIDAGFYVIPEGHTEDSFYDFGLEAFFNFAKNIPLTTSDGRMLVGSSHATGLDGYLLSFRDITELRRAEDKQLESVRDALQSLTDGVALFDTNLEFVLGNERYFEMWYPGAIEKPYAGEPLADIVRRALREGTLKLPDGASIEETAEELVQRIRDYQKNVPLESQGATHIASAHKTSLGGYLLEFTDISDRLRAEEELARQKEISHQNEKLSALGELLAGVAHELNNPLSVVFGYAQMLEGKIDDPRIAERLDLIRQSAERAAKIVRTFLAMARQRPTKIELCSLNEAVTTAIEVSSYGLTANGTRVVTELDGAVPSVAGDFDQLAQVFTNLIVNAGHALEAQRENGVLTLRSYYAADSDHTVVEVHDNGPGIPKEIQTRIFEPFFTTKDVGQGTGVGLAFSHRIIESHGGLLELTSAPGHGTSFRIKLRSAKEAPPTAARTAEPQEHGKASILVVDDEAGVAQLTRDILAEEGYRVTQSLSPRDALMILEGQTFDLVLSDFKMPGMDGEHFYKALSLVAPDYARRIGFITGDAMSAHVRDFFRTCGCPYIEKPIIKEELLSLVRKLSSTGTEKQH